jgi:ubiquinone/menaquinone biosynthesis C-methylase UbiE
MTETSNMKKFPHVCPPQLAFLLDNWIRRLIQSPNKILREYVKESDTVVDVGCGPGFFSIEMARLVGENGKVLAVDLQEQMLEHVNRKARKYGLADRIETHLCGEQHIGLNRKADFILAFYMVHETQNPGAFFQEAKAMLKDGGRLLVVEPKMHVKQSEFERTVAAGSKTGLKPIGFPKNKGGRAVLFML